VSFAFLPVVGWNSTTIHSAATGEAASLDLVLVIDISSSMSYDLCCDGQDNDGDGTIDDCFNGPDGGWLVARSGAIDDCDVATCTANGTCQPFEDVRTAAIGLLDYMTFPFDRMSIITFARQASLLVSLQAGTSRGAVQGVLEAMAVAPDPIRGETDGPCGSLGDPADPRGCTSTNSADGLRGPAAEFGSYGRQEAVWVVIFLSDGGANAAVWTDENPILPESWICPGTAGLPTWIQPSCRDPYASTRHSSAAVDEYDADDAARDWADFLGCLYEVPSGDHVAGCPAGGGQGAVVFTIGLGRLMVEAPSCDPYYAGSCDPDLGEHLLRYIAAVGDDGDPYTDPCSSASAGSSCGNYYFASGGADLDEIFDAIASRIFTRITD
jgi:hypothetical protein